MPGREALRPEPAIVAAGKTLIMLAIVDIRQSHSPAQATVESGGQKIHIQLARRILHVQGRTWPADAAASNGSGAGQDGGCFRHKKAARRKSPSSLALARSIIVSSPSASITISLISVTGRPWYDAKRSRRCEVWPVAAKGFHLGPALRRTVELGDYGPRERGPGVRPRRQ